MGGILDEKVLVKNSGSIYGGVYADWYERYRICR